LEEGNGIRGYPKGRRPLLIEREGYSPKVRKIGGEKKGFIRLLGRGGAKKVGIEKAGNL